MAPFGWRRAEVECAARASGPTPRRGAAAQGQRRDQQEDSPVLLLHLINRVGALGWRPLTHVAHREIIVLTRSFGFNKRSFEINYEHTVATTC